VPFKNSAVPLQISQLVDRRTVGFFGAPVYQCLCKDLAVPFKDLAVPFKDLAAPLQGLRSAF